MTVDVEIEGGVEAFGEAEGELLDDDGVSLGDVHDEHHPAAALSSLQMNSDLREPAGAPQTPLDRFDHRVFGVDDVALLERDVALDHPASGTPVRSSDLDALQKIANARLAFGLVFGLFLFRVQIAFTRNRWLGGDVFVVGKMGGVLGGDVRLTRLLGPGTIGLLIWNRCGHT